MKLAIAKRSAALRPQILALTVAATIVGCDKSSPSHASAQAVASVNGTEITVPQIAQVMHEIGADASAPNAEETALEALIDQQLLFEEAAKSQLDRNPNVALALESARRQIMARAYVQRVILPQNRVGKSELKNYYNDNPLLFSQRKIYQFHAFRIDPNKVNNNAFKNELDATRTSDEVRAVLHKQKIDFSEESLVRAAEQLPLALLAKAAAAKVGDIIIVPGNSNQLLLELTASENKPLTLAEASPYIEHFLLNLRNRQALQQQLKRLRAIGQVTYLARFTGKTKLAASTPQRTTSLAPPEMDAVKSLENNLILLK